MCVGHVFLHGCNAYSYQTTDRDVADRDQSPSYLRSDESPEWALAIARPIRYSHIRLLDQVDKAIMRNMQCIVVNSRQPACWTRPPLRPHREARLVLGAGPRGLMPSCLGLPSRCRDGSGCGAHRFAADCCGVERGSQVGNDVVWMLDADRQPHVAGCDAGRKLLFGRKLRVRRGRGMDSQ